MGRKIIPTELIKGIYRSAIAMDQPFNEEQGELLIDIMSYKKPHLYLPKLRKSKIYTEEQLVMIGTALNQNYAGIPTLMPDFPEVGFNEHILAGIKETVQKKGKMTEAELKKKYGINP